MSESYIRMTTSQNETFENNLTHAEALADTKEMPVKFYSWDRGREIMVEQV